MPRVKQRIRRRQAEFKEDEKNYIGFLIGDQNQEGFLYKDNNEENNSEQERKYLELLKNLNDNGNFPYTDDLLNPTVILTKKMNGEEYYFVNLKPGVKIRNNSNLNYEIDGFDEESINLGGIIIGERDKNPRNRIAKIIWANDTIITENNVTENNVTEVRQSQWVGGRKNRSRKSKRKSRKQSKKKSAKKSSKKSKRKSARKSRKSRKSVKKSVKKSKSLKNKKGKYDKYIGKVVYVKYKNNQRRRFRWIVKKRDDGRYIVRAPKIGVLVRDLDLLRDKDYNKETLLPKDAIIA